VASSYKINTFIMSTNMWGHDVNNDVICSVSKLSS